MKTRHLTGALGALLLLAAGALAGPPADSLYQLRSGWTTQAGKRVTLDSLAGHPVLVAMIYTSCQASCPLTVSEMQAIEKRLTPETAEATRFVLVSFDPARDTPARLAQVEREHHLTRGRWVLLTGADDGVRELAAALGFRYQPLEGGEFTHSNLLTVLGRDGRILKQLSGTGQDPTELVKSLEAQAAAR